VVQQKNCIHVFVVILLLVLEDSSQCCVRAGLIHVHLESIYGPAIATTDCRVSQPSNLTTTICV